MKPDDDAATVTQLLDDSESAFKTLLAQSLQAAVAQPAPLGVSYDDWTTLTAQIGSYAGCITDAKDLVHVNEYYEKAWKVLLDALITGLRSMADGQTEVLAHLAKAAEYSELAMPAQAQTEYNAAREGWKAPAGREERLTVAGGAQESLLAVSFPRLRTDATAEPTKQYVLSTQSELYKGMRRFQMWATFFVGAVAIVLGLSTLWVPNTGWGSAGDVIAALIWGAGLSGASFAGVSSLMQQFGLSKSAP